MTSRSFTWRTALASALVLSTMLASPVMAGAPATAKDAKSLPAIEETIIVTEVQLEPVTLASKILDSDAYMKDGTKIGDVSDVVFDADNRVSAVIVGIGGFLGIDETHVAIPMSKVSFETKGKTMKVIADVTKQDLQNAKRSA
jgi:sporulation protein YlmC with PRC-barrel domain